MSSSLSTSLEKKDSSLILNGEDAVMRKKEPGVQIQTFTVTRRITLEERTCPQCGKRFVGRKNKKFCSRACVRKATYEKHGDEYRKARVEKYHAEKQAAAGKQ